MKKKSTLIGLHDMVTLNNAYFLHSATDNVFVYHRKKQTAEISSFLYLYKKCNISILNVYEQCIWSTVAGKTLPVHVICNYIKTLITKQALIEIIITKQQFFPLCN